MEGNKDEALRCVELAEKYLAEGKYDKAEKFLQKGQKLFPTSKAESTCHRSSRPIFRPTSLIVYILLITALSLFPQTFWRA